MLTYTSSHTINYTTYVLVAVGPTVEVSGAQIAGENYTLTCQVTGGENMTSTFQWFNNGAQVVNEKSATLSFSPLNQTSHNGSYTCEITQGGVTLRSAAVNIAVAGMG